MPVCSFCKVRFKEPRGLTVFTFDGRSVFYCSSKCRKNQLLGRDSKKVNWIRKRKDYLEASEPTEMTQEITNPETISQNKEEKKKTK